MTAVEQILDSIHTIARCTERSTRRKKRLQREHILGVFHVARVVISGLAVVVPKAASVAFVLNNLNDHIKKKELDATNSRSDL